MNKHLNTIVIAPMTTTTKPNPTRVSIQRSPTEGSIALDQIRTIDKTRILKVLESELFPDFCTGLP